MYLDSKLKKCFLLKSFLIRSNPPKLTSGFNGVVPLLPFCFSLGFLLSVSMSGVELVLLLLLLLLLEPLLLSLLSSISLNPSSSSYTSKVKNLYQNKQPRPCAAQKNAALRKHHFSPFVLFLPFFFIFICLEVHERNIREYVVLPNVSFRLTQVWQNMRWRVR